MLRRTTLAMALVAGSLLAGLAAPAHAVEDDRALVRSAQINRTLGGFIISVPTPEARCGRSGGGGLFSTPYDYSGASPTTAPSRATPGSASGPCSATASTAPS